MEFHVYNFLRPLKLPSFQTEMKKIWNRRHGWSRNRMKDTENSYRDDEGKIEYTAFCALHKFEETIFEVKKRNRKFRMGLDR